MPHSALSPPAACTACVRLLRVSPLACALHKYTGNEGNILAGATRLFARRTVAHVFLEFNPRLIRRSGTTPLAVIERLHAAGFMCFDARVPTHAPWAVDRTHPLGADGFVRALDKHEAAALRGRAPPKWAVAFGAFDDLACANVAKVWRPTDPLEGKSQP